MKIGEMRNVPAAGAGRPPAKMTDGRWQRRAEARPSARAASKPLITLIDSATRSLAEEELIDLADIHFHTIIPSPCRTVQGSE